MTDLHPILVTQRLQLADTLDTLEADQWSTQSLCDGWTVRDVLAHLTYPATASKFRIFVDFAKAGFDLDKMTKAVVAADAATGPELNEKFRATSSHRWTPPGFGFEAPLTDAVAHASDICRPLRIPNKVSPDAARSVLDFLVSPKATRGFVPKGRVDGLRFETTDLNWGFGEGPTVAGSSEAVIMGILGRRAVYDDLTGDGVPAFVAK